MLDMMAQQHISVRAAKAEVGRRETPVQSSGGTAG